MTKIPKKRGQLSLEEENFIKTSISSLSIEEIANSINRNTKPVERFITEEKLLVANEETAN